MYDIYGWGYPNLIKNRLPVFYSFLCKTASKNMIKAMKEYVSADGSVRFFTEIFAGKWYDDERTDHFFQDVSKYLDLTVVRQDIKKAADMMISETGRPITADELIGIELILRELTVMKKELEDNNKITFNMFGHYLFYLLGTRIEMEDLDPKDLEDEVYKILWEIDKTYEYSEDNLTIAWRVTNPSDMRYLNSWFNTMQSNGDVFFGTRFVDGIKKLKETDQFEAEKVFKDLGLDEESLCFE